MFFTGESKLSVARWELTLPGVQGYGSGVIAGSHQRCSGSRELRSREPFYFFGLRFGRASLSASAPSRLRMKAPSSLLADFLC